MSLSFNDYLAETKKMVREITVDDLAEWIGSDRNTVIIDVREKDEHEQGVVPGSKAYSSRAARAAYRAQFPIEARQWL